MKKRGLSAARRSCNHRHAAIGQGKRRHRKSAERPSPAVWKIADQLIDGYHDYLLYIFRGRAFGARVQRVQKVQRVQRGRLTGLCPEGCGRLSAAGYVRFAQGATAPAALKVADCRSAATLIKSALRDLLSVPYGMISILRIGSLRSPPPFRLRRTSPASGGRIKHQLTSTLAH